MQIPLRYEKVVSSKPDIQELIAENTCQSPWTLPQLRYSFKHLLNLTDKSLLSLRSSMLKMGK